MDTNQLTNYRDNLLKIVNYYKCNNNNSEDILIDIEDAINEINEYLEPKINLIQLNEIHENNIFITTNVIKKYSDKLRDKIDYPHEEKDIDFENFKEVIKCLNSSLDFVSNYNKLDSFK